MKKMPTLRLLVFFAIGIIVQFHNPFSIKSILLSLAIFTGCFFGFYVLSLKQKFAFYWLKASFIFGSFFCLGCLFAFINLLPNSKHYFGHYYSNQEPILVCLQEDVVVKPKSYKAQAKIVSIQKNDKWIPVNGNVLLYFRKDSIPPNLKYGSHIVIAKRLLPIVNSGNPGGFNYARYCSFQGNYHQVFLKPNEYTIQSFSSINATTNFLNGLRTKILSILKANVPNPQELAIAEALLIGYREDLDRDLVRAYSNIGIVHIIAISGLHLGMIYSLLLFAFKPFGHSKYIRFLKPICIIAVLWIFTGIAGMQPSIVRSAIMFSCIAIGDSLGKKTNMYNSLVLSAFIILLVNPFALWDVGFQLSYAAVLSIVVFSPYIKKWVFVKNKILQNIFYLNAITLSAQILTLPIVLYHFHQFPILFLLTNLVAVPLSGLVLYALILLLIIAPIKTLALGLGKVISACLWWLNKFVLWVDDLGFAVLPNLQISILQAVLLMLAVIGFGRWLISKKYSFLLIGLSSCLLFISLRSWDMIERKQQQKIVVYNVPNFKGIDIIEGRHNYFIGDDTLTKEGFLQNFHIKPSRILHRISPMPNPSNFVVNENLIGYGKHLIALIDKPLSKINDLPIEVEAVVLSKNPKLNLQQLTQHFRFKKLVIDGSNPFWKVEQWKQQAASLNLKLHITATDGAFEINF